MQRSGTSLMRAIVGSHPDVAIFEWDLPLWTYLHGHYKEKDLSSPAVLTDLLDAIFSDKKMMASDVDLNRQGIENKIGRSGEEITCGTVFQCLLEEYANRLGRSRWGLKTPHNEFFAEEIYSAYPNARMVQLIRDPRDVAVSFRSYDGGAWNYRAGEHMVKWKKSAELAYLNSQRFKGRYLCVRYEDLVNDPQKTIDDVCQTLDLKFNPAMLEANGQLGWQGSNSFFDDIGTQSKVISTAGIGRYLTQLDSDLIYRYQKQLRTELLQLGYQLEDFGLCQQLRFFVKRISEQWGRSVQH